MPQHPPTTYLGPSREEALPVLTDSEAPGVGPDGQMLVPTQIVAIWLGVSPSTLRRWCRAGQFPPAAVGGDRRGSTMYWPMRVVLREYLRRHGLQSRPGRPSSRGT